jgi:hypothetical protein
LAEETAKVGRGVYGAAPELEASAVDARSIPSRATSTAVTRLMADMWFLTHIPGAAAPNKVVPHEQRS